MSRYAYETFVCSCGEHCIMIPHCSTGKPAPITEALYDDGNIEFVSTSLGAVGTYRIASQSERSAHPEPRRLNHFVNCPDRAEFGGRPR